MADIVKDDPWSYGVVETWSFTRGNEENRESLLKCTYRLSLYIIITKNIFTFILPGFDTHVTTLYGYSLEQINPCNAFVMIIINNRIYNTIIMLIWSRGGTIVLRRLRYNDNDRDSLKRVRNSQDPTKLWFYLLVYNYCLSDSYVTAMWRYCVCGWNGWLEFSNKLYRLFL